MTDPSNHQDIQRPVEHVVSETTTTADDLPTAGKLPTAAASDAGQQPQIDTEVMWLHGLFFWMALAVIGATFLLRSEGQESVFFPGAKQAMPELCASRRMFGLPCPGCGLTRSFISISHGQFARAWSFNPVSFLLYPFIFIQIPWHAMQYLLIRKRGYGVQLPYVHIFPIAIAITLLLRWLALVPQMF